MGRDAKTGRRDSQIRALRHRLEMRASEMRRERTRRNWETDLQRWGKKERRDSEPERQ